MPFGNDCEFADFAACTTANADKDDPDAYCAALMEATEAACAARSGEPMTTTRKSTDEQRSEAAERRREGTTGRSTRPQLEARSQGNGDTEPGDVRARSVTSAAQFRTDTAERDGKDFFLVDGYATTWEQRYEMWDVFGPYDEVVSRGAADATLAAKPDVAFLINHRGLTLARTAGPWNGGKGTLDLSVDEHGLRDVAWLNPERDEVRNLRLAMEDGQVTEQSFAFMLDEGEWNDDFTEFRITRFDINRGDVSAVNYGANPTTSIAGRQQELLTDLRLAGPATAAAATATLLQRGDLDLDELARRFEEIRRPERERRQEQAATGRSIVQVEAMLLD